MKTHLTILLLWLLVLAGSFDAAKSIAQTLFHHEKRMFHTLKTGFRHDCPTNGGFV